MFGCGWRSTRRLNCFRSRSCESKRWLRRSERRAFSPSPTFAASVPLLHESAFINGHLTKAADGAVFQVSNPANGELIGVVPDMGEEDAAKAVAAAQTAFPEWRERTAKERSALLKNWFQLLTQNSQDLAKLLTIEQGKPLAESVGEMSYSNSFIEWFAEEARRVYGDVVPSPVPSKRILHFKQPVGVVGVITPWNFPSAMITRKAGAALAAGCPVVVKPAEDTPYSAIALAVLAQEAGIPPGIFNVVTASRSKTPAVAKVLCEDPRVKKISFTGSTAVGKILMRQCAEGVKKMSLELGGNAPFVVFESARIEEAVAGAIANKFRNMGQTCVCTNRFFVHDSVHDAFVAKLGAALDDFRLGDGLVSGVDQGPLINAAAVEKVDRLVQDAVASGAQTVKGGAVAKQHGPNFYQPTLLTQVNLDMSIAREEIFGPVATIIKFKSEDEVVAMANATPYGLSGYFYSQDVSQIWRVASRLEFGMIGVNEGAISTTEAAFGGVKQSGFGRESSKYGIDEYLDVKYICLGGMRGGVC